MGSDQQKLFDRAMLPRRVWQGHAHYGSWVAVPGAFPPTWPEDHQVVFDQQ